MDKNAVTNEFAHTAGNASMIGASAIMGAFVGFFLQLLVAYYFGAGTDSDSYFMALSTSEMLSKLLLGGSITAVFIPILVEKLARQKEEAWRLSLNLIHLSISVLLAALILVGLFAYQFVAFIAPGFNQASRDLTVRLLLILLPSFGALFLVDLISAILQATRSFLVPALLRIIAPAVSIITLVLWQGSIGIFALALGVVLGSFIQLSFVLWGLYRQGWRYHFVWQVNDPAIRQLFRLTYPFLLAVLMTQAAGITYRILVSDLSSGSLASLKFAEKITQLLTIVFLNSVTVVIYPLLSAKAAAHDMAGVRQTIGGAIRLVCFTTLPIMAAVILLRQPIVSFMYQRGSFSPQDAQMTSTALLFFIIGLTINGISSIFGHATLALKETRAAVAVTAASQAIAIFLFILLVPAMNHTGLALGSSLVPIAIASLYFLYLTRFIPHLPQVFLHRTFLKIGVLVIIMTAVLWLLIPLSSNLSPLRPFSQFLQIFVPTFIGGCIYLLGAYWWRIPEIIEVVRIVRNKIGK